MKETPGHEFTQDRVDLSRTNQTYNAIHIKSNMIIENHNSNLCSLDLPVKEKEIGKMDLQGQEQEQGEGQGQGLGSLSQTTTTNSTNSNIYLMNLSHLKSLFLEKMKKVKKISRI